MINRRRFIATGTSGLLLGGCDRLNNSAQFRGVLRSAEKLTMASQRLISPRDALAREFRESDISPIFRSNGTRVPGTDEYAQHAAEHFANWRLQVDGLVAHPLSIPLTTLRTLPWISRRDKLSSASRICSAAVTVTTTTLNLHSLMSQVRCLMAAAQRCSWGAAFFSWPSSAGLRIDDATRR